MMLPLRPVEWAEPASSSLPLTDVRHYRAPAAFQRGGGTCGDLVNH